jgi:hypothetical protein
MSETLFDTIPDVVDGLPNISGWEEPLRKAIRDREPAFLPRTPMWPDKVQSGFAVALHMHQPLVLTDGDLRQAPMIGNLQYMMERQHVHGNHDAPAYATCYSRMADFIRSLVGQGRHPRIMLDYSGELLFGLRQMGRSDILDNLKSITLDERYWPSVEWLGTLWGHAVVPSTPIPDVELQIRAWQHHFASMFGWDALGRVRGFSPPEMHLPNHPDVSYSYIKALRDAGYQWLLVQEHSVEELDGQGLRERYLPRRLVARNSRGEEVTITALIKTQGSDTKLVGHMQPYHEARSLRPRPRGKGTVPPLVLQISDGENGGVMMNEFPPHFHRTWLDAGTEGVVGMNGTEYLELLAMVGLTEKDFEPIQPLHQAAVWSRVGSRISEESVRAAIAEAARLDHRFGMDGGSWTNNVSWVRGYENVLDPMNRLSVEFHRKLDGMPVDRRGHAYRNALFHLLVSQTSCYRYWGQGRFTDMAREISRRGLDILKYDFPGGVTKT